MGLFSKKEKYKRIGQVPVTPDTISINPIEQQIPQPPQVEEEESEELKVLMEVTEYLDKLVSYLKYKLQ